MGFCYWGSEVVSRSFKTLHYHKNEVLIGCTIDGWRRTSLLMSSSGSDLLFLIYIHRLHAQHSKLKRRNYFSCFCVCHSASTTILVSVLRTLGETVNSETFQKLFSFQTCFFFSLPQYTSILSPSRDALTGFMSRLWLGQFSFFFSLFASDPSGCSWQYP